MRLFNLLVPSLLILIACQNNETNGTAADLSTECPKPPDLAPPSAKCAAAAGLTGTNLICVDFNKLSSLSELPAHVPARDKVVPGLSRSIPHLSLMFIPPSLGSTARKGATSNQIMSFPSVYQSQTFRTDPAPDGKRTYRKRIVWDARLTETSCTACCHSG